MYEVGDIVLAGSCAGPAIPAVHVRLIKRIDVKASKGRGMDWPAYVGWECELTKPKEADMLRKKWSIPFRFPDNISSFVYEKHIVKITQKRRKRIKSAHKTN